MFFKFEPNIEYYIDDKLLNGCLKCGKKRWIGEYVCIEHLNEDIPSLKKQAIKKINSESKSIMKNIELLDQLDVPDNLYCSFNEKGKKYDLVFGVEYKESGNI